MKTQKINLVNMKERLNRDEMKSIRGGYDEMEGGVKGGCIRCDADSGMSSCWYTTSSGSDLCIRVYPGQTGTYTPVVCGPDCRMN